MDRTPVKSSNVVSVGYDPTAKRLEVEFRGGGIYHYHDVSPETHRELMAAKSIGGHVHGQIKGKHRATKG